MTNKWFSDIQIRWQTGDWYCSSCLSWIKKNRQKGRLSICV